MLKLVINILKFIIIFIFLPFFNINVHTNSVNAQNNFIIEQKDIEEKEAIVVELPNEKKINDWRLTLVNYENELQEGYVPELTYLDRTRQFDSRAIDELNQMLKDIKNSGINDIWVQSAYRSIEYQEEVFNKKVNFYIERGLSIEEAESLTLQTINRPKTSEHNLGLSVDFNYVDYTFDTTEGFRWLEENAENYGFVLRYKKEKENITKINYEPWHWRYVGVEHAKRMNELDMCLEEYIEYLKYN